MLDRQVEQSTDNLQETFDGTSLEGLVQDMMFDLVPKLVE